MVVPETITKLIERFDFHPQSHISSRDVYNETKLRQHEKTLLSRQIEATDASIDKLVYELYGLTEEEVKIVEGK